MSTVEETLGGRNEVVSSGPAIEERKDKGGSNNRIYKLLCVSGGPIFPQNLYFIISFY